VERRGQLHVLSEVCIIRVLLYWPTPLALKAFTLDLYMLLKWSPSTVQMVSVPTYTSCQDNTHTHTHTHTALPVKLPDTWSVYGVCSDDAEGPASLSAGPLEARPVSGWGGGVEAR